jgi:hypothetical protein
VLVRFVLMLPYFTTAIRWDAAKSHEPRMKQESAKKMERCDRERRAIEML